MSPLAQAGRLYRRHPRLRRFFWQPVLLAVAVYAAAAALAIWGGASLASGLTSSFLPSWLGQSLGAALASVVLLFLAGPLMAALISLISAFRWDALTREVAEIQGWPPAQPLSRQRMALEIALRLSFSFAGLVAAVILSFTGFWWAAALVTGLLGFADFTAAASQREGLGFPKSLFMAFRKKGALPLWLLASASAVFPLLYALVLPYFAAAGACLAGQSHVLPHRPVD